MESDDGSTSVRCVATGEGVSVEVEAMGFGFGFVLTVRDVRALQKELTTALHREEMENESLG